MSGEITEKQKFIEDVGIMFENLGVGRTPGRIIAALMIASPPRMNMTQLTEELMMSKGSISSGLNLLLSTGFVSKVSIPGERADYYEVNESFFTQAVTSKGSALTSFKDLIARALEFLEDDEYPQRKQTLLEMQAMYSFFDRRLPQLFEEWEEIMKKGDYKKFL